MKKLKTSSDGITSGFIAFLKNYGVIGLAIAVRHETSVDQILGRADVALYRAKGSGRNRVAFDRRADAA